MASSRSVSTMSRCSHTTFPALICALALSNTSHLSKFRWAKSSWTLPWVAADAWTQSRRLSKSSCRKAAQRSLRSAICIAWEQSCIAAC